ncbi:hypothetical protein N7528_008059 [Penicillium herquei]|nr:hypothetical protein N7528_008059 [Penicillium herquei]
MSDPNNPGDLPNKANVIGSRMDKTHQTKSKLFRKARIAASGKQRYRWIDRPKLDALLVRDDPDHPGSFRENMTLDKLHIYYT